MVKERDAPIGRGRDGANAKKRDNASWLLFFESISPSFLGIERRLIPRAFSLLPCSRRWRSGHHRLHSDGSFRSAHHRHHALLPMLLHQGNQSGVWNGNMYKSGPRRRPNRRRKRFMTRVHHPHSIYAKDQQVRAKEMKGRLGCQTLSRSMCLKFPPHLPSREVMRCMKALCSSLPGCDRVREGGDLPSGPTAQGRIQRARHLQRHPLHRHVQVCRPQDRLLRRPAARGRPEMK